MLEIADVAVADAARERDSAHHPIAFQRAADPRSAVQRSEVPCSEISGRLEVVRRRFGYQVYRPADGIAAIQGALRAAKYLNAIEIEKLHERHCRAREVDAIEIQR